MRIILNLLLLFIISNHAFGQIATIKDKDGWTNVREEPMKFFGLISITGKMEMIGLQFTFLKTNTL